MATFKESPAKKFVESFGKVRLTAIPTTDEIQMVVGVLIRCGFGPFELNATPEAMFTGPCNGNFWPVNTPQWSANPMYLRLDISAVWNDGASSSTTTIVNPEFMDFDSTFSNSDSSAPGPITNARADGSNILINGGTNLWLPGPPTSYLTYNQPPDVIGRYDLGILALGTNLTGMTYSISPTSFSIAYPDSIFPGDGYPWNVIIGGTITYTLSSPCPMVTYLGYVTALLNSATLLDDIWNPGKTYSCVRTITPPFTPTDPPNYALKYYSEFAFTGGETNIIGVFNSRAYGVTYTIPTGIPQAQPLWAWGAPAYADASTSFFGFPLTPETSYDGGGYIIACKSAVRSLGGISSVQLVVFDFANNDFLEANKPNIVKGFYVFDPTGATPIPPGYTAFPSPQLNGYYLRGAY